jgi:hypothetical protein
MSSAPTEEPPTSDAAISSCVAPDFMPLALKLEANPPLHSSHCPEHSSSVSGPNPEEELTDGSVEDDPDDDDEIAMGLKGQHGDSAPNSFESEGAPALGLDSVAASGNSRQRIRIRGYRPLDELRSFAKVLITSLNREFVTPRLDYSMPCPASLSEGLGDAHIMGTTLFTQMRLWLSDPNGECARDMAAYFKVSSSFIQPLYFSYFPHTLISLFHFRSKVNSVCRTAPTGTTSSLL